MKKIDKCSEINRRITIRSIQEFAALWCGVPEEDVSMFLFEETYPVNHSTAMGSIILRSEKLPCLEPRIRFIIAAINENRVECCDETGNFRGNANIAWGRKCLRYDKAKEWLERSALPRDELPDFLFENYEDHIPETQEGLEEAKQKIKELEEIIKEKNKYIEELEQLKVDYDKNSPVNAERWRHSCRCLAKAFASYIIVSNNKKLTKKDFLNFMGSRVEGFSNPLGIVEEIAWQELPQALKMGVGRPSSSNAFDFDYVQF